MYNDDQYVTNGIPWRRRNQMPGNLADARHLTSKTWYLAVKDSMTSMSSGKNHYTTVVIMYVGAFIHSLFPNLSYRFNIMTQYIYI